MSPRSIVPSVVAAISAALVALLIYGVVHGGNNTSLDDAVKAGKRPVAPGLTMRRPVLGDSGAQRALADYRGKVVVLNFWASWCGPCADEAPVLERTQAQLTKSGTGTVLGASYNDASDDALGFEHRHKLTYPSVRDVGTSLAEKYGTHNLPETFVIDAQGRVVAVSRGEVSEAFLRRALAKAQQTTVGST